MKLATWTPKQIAAAERTLSAGTWAITAGAILFSVLTVTPLVERVTPDEWDWTAPILPLVVDAAVVIVIRLDSTVSRLGGEAGAWPVVLRWLTGAFTVALNIGDSALKGEAVGVAVHAVAPALLIVTAEAGLAYRRAIAKALDRIERERAEEEERQRVHERAEREARERAQREREQREREDRERELERAERLERERREHEAKLEREARAYEAERAREQREFEAEQRREEAARIEREQERQRAEQERREHLAAQQREREQAEREQREREAREQAARERRERQRVNATANGRGRSVNAPATTAVNGDRMPEEEARTLVLNTPTASVRQLAEMTGWSVGWVSKTRRDSSTENGARLAVVGGER
ncbi:hypothetical protein [Actinomadura sp. 21ATH]|uniref:hypothetical protein n=1 Tax=Actinomadura sp. 21ATH TaxID=1735444 RepID=UPI0035BF3653